MYRLLVPAAAIAVSLAGCSFLEPASTTSTSTTEPEQTSVATTVAPSTTLTNESPCLAGDRPFAVDGLVSAFGGNNGDATQISGIRHAMHPGCEQVLVDFLTADGAPAGGLDPVGVEYDASTGVVRVSLPAQISRSAVADSLLDGALVDRAFVVSTENNIAIDIHLAAGRAYSLRAYEADSPSRIVIDIKEESEGEPVPGTTVGSGVVVVNPPAGSVQAPLQVTGYVKGVYETVTVELFSETSDEPLTTQTIEPAEGENIWHEFSVRFRDFPATPMELIVTPGSTSDRSVRISIDGSAPSSDQ